MNKITLSIIIVNLNTVDLTEGCIKSIYENPPKFSFEVFVTDNGSNDGSVEIVTGTENGGGPQLRIFNKDGNLIHPGFFAYDTKFRGGVNVAIGDLNGDNVNEIIAGAGVGG